MEKELTFGAWLRHRRRQLDLTQAALAERVGYSVVTIRKLERNELRPSKQLAERLAQGLEVAVGQQADIIALARTAAAAPSTVDSSVETLPAQSIGRDHLPSHPTPFVGRAAEQSKMADCLSDPDCRLLTICGSGGIGKSRLALRVAQNVIDSPAHAASFQHGVYFVPLAAVDSPALLVSRIADAISFVFHGETESETQLFRYLHNKMLLLVLDNCEQLVTNADFFSKILAEAPHVKIIATSRMALNLREEWYFPIAGLDFPDFSQAEMTTTALEAYDAVQLFIHNARRVLPFFSIATEQESVMRICRLVEGMPLAIELATTWLRVLSCKTLASELQRNLDMLESSLSNMPERHRSIRTVFEHSWRLLAAEERTVLAGLSIFRSGFHQVAAEQVAGATLSTLARLVEKSILSTTATGRYHIHLLLRQFSEEKLASLSQTQAPVQERHSEYYLAFLAQRAEKLLGPQQFSILEEIGQEIDNINIGWRWAARAGKIEWIDQALDSLYNIYWLRSRYAEGVDAFGSAIELLESSRHDGKVEFVLARMQARQAALLYSLGRYPEARALIQEGLAVARQLGVKQEIAFCLNFMGKIAWWQESALAALPLLEESLALSREISDQMGLANTLHTLSWLFGAASEPEKAWRFGKESLTISRLAGHTYHIAHALHRLGATAFVLGDYVTAVSYCHEGLSAFRQLGDRYGMALMLAELGRSMYASGIYPRETFLPLLVEGAALSRDSGNYVAMYPAIGILGKISNLIGEYEVGQRCGQELLDLLPGQSYPYLPHCLIILGWAHLGQGNYQDASHYLRGAFAVALKAQPIIRSIIMWALLASAHLLHAVAALPELIDQPRVRQQKQELALGMVAHVLNDPQAWPFWKQHAAPLAAKLAALVPPEVAAAASAQEMQLDLMTTAASVLAELERDS